ncbi:general substrate transporter [Burkholderia multivorans]|uniref:MFS transporter n=1 Tax=Burkholderia multivorans TaxID=87883 RepID=UPI000CFF06EB|nr:MFS transporter [Burkholderia multivorans]MCL4660597.1 MFS transporter [Burkholderia multivorans]MCO1352031.1 MFS transporter [Burkholderia multivorans]MCO1414125.1 MFS transporter [Burkholderia multivorans]MCO1445688.1 MFS transporter [Burkholderia multivorans]PRH32448.1 MFS transporter [Burkholderia multivorans]
METRKAAWGTSGRERWKIIISSSLGTAFEWYDFLLYGALAPIIAKEFFSGVNETAAFIFALLTFSAGFVARPFGSLVFGLIGDLVGRKRTFVATIMLMALPTFLVGLLPGYASWGIWAPATLIVLRVLQGLAVGGEYGGALVYVAEHSMPNRRGLDTSWLSAMTPAGIILALSATLATRTLVGEAALTQWAWRVPFLASILLFGISMWLRLKLRESPIFAEMKAAGRAARRPLREAFGEWRHLRTGILLTFGVNTAIGVIAYTSEFYTQFFMGRTLAIDPVTINWIMLPSLLLSIPTYIVFGWLTDRLGRKPVFIAGTLLAALTLQPAFRLMTHYGNEALEHAQQSAPVVVYADPASCSTQFDPVGAAQLRSSCDIAKGYLASHMISYTNAALPAGSVAAIGLGGKRIPAFEAAGMTKQDFQSRNQQFQATVRTALDASGYPARADPSRVNHLVLIVIMTYLLSLLGMIYTPAGAWMTELFPTRIRYTAISLPYNIGAGWVGGFMPSVAFAMVAANGGIYFGLWYPVTALAIAVVISTFCLPETRNQALDAPIGDAHPDAGTPPATQTHPEMRTTRP